MDREAVRPDLNILVPERLRVENYLHHHPLLDIRHRVNSLKLFGCLYLCYIGEQNVQITDKTI